MKLNFLVRLSPLRLGFWALVGCVMGLVGGGTLHPALAPVSAAYGQGAPTSVFEIALPDLGLGPTAQPDLRIPSPAARQILIYVLRPQADEIDYGQIFAKLNGEATAGIFDITAGERGKLLRMDLTRLPGYQLKPGRNTVEVWATSRRNRTYYASFVLRTTTENFNEALASQSTLGNDPTQRIPPELVLLEPTQAVELATAQTRRTVRVRGYAAAANQVTQVTVNGQPVALKPGAPTTRDLVLVHTRHVVSFDVNLPVTTALSEIIIEAVDASTNRTQLQVPVRLQGAGHEPTQFSGRKFALLIGISKFSSRSINPLNYADADALALHKFLQTPAAGSFPASNMRLLTNEQATAANVRAALQSFVALPETNDLLVIFLATHGGADPFAAQNLYFVAHDSELEKLTQTALLMQDVQRLLQENVRAKRVVMYFDTCHSAGLMEPPNVTTRKLGNNLVSLYAEKLYQEEGRAIITSADVNESAEESSQWGGGHGVFTHFLLRGLQGEADANNDRYVTLGEAFRFVRRRVQAETQNKQHPRLLIGTNENFPLAVATTAGK